MKLTHPSREECLELLKQYKTPPHVIKHCVAVADTAIKIAEALNKKGYSLDVDLVRGAALIHDIARVEEEHAKRGSEIASDLGYNQEAAIIKVHMRYSPFSTVENVNETDLVCLADRMVKEDEYVGLNSRMNSIIERVRKQGYEDAEQRILAKKKEAQRLIKGIEDVLGTSMDQLMTEER